jgi:hypothetical protein
MAETVLSSFVAFLCRNGAMKPSKFTTREGLVMLLGIALVLIVMLWLILAGIVQFND